MLQLTTILFLISFSLLALLHYLAIKLFLYWRFEWFDIPMHFFGGAVVALGVFTLKDLRFIPSTWTKLVPLLLIMLFVALAWEAFEVFAVQMDQEKYVQDTISDLILGLVGGYVGFMVGKRLHNL